MVKCFAPWRDNILKFFIKPMTMQKIVFYLLHYNLKQSKSWKNKRNNNSINPWNVLMINFSELVRREIDSFFGEIPLDKKL